MLTNDELQRVERLVRLAPYMNQEQQEGLLKLIRELKSADAAGVMPQSAVQSMVDVIDDKTMRAIVEEQRHRPGPGWFKPEGQSEPRKRGTGWQKPPKPQDRTNQ